MTKKKCSKLSCLIKNHQRREDRRRTRSKAQNTLQLRRLNRNTQLVATSTAGSFDTNEKRSSSKLLPIPKDREP